jgi:hypothetical protein
MSSVLKAKPTIGRDIAFDPRPHEDFIVKRAQARMIG